jgi:hypothetical protein
MKKTVIAILTLSVLCFAGIAAAEETKQETTAPTSGTTSTPAPTVQTPPAK